MFYKNEKKLIDTIKYAPIVLIIFLFVITTYFVEKSNTKQFNEETKRLTNFYRDCNGCYVLGQSPKCGTSENCASASTAPTSLKVSLSLDYVLGYQARVIAVM